MVDHFYDGVLDLGSINTTFIALIPKFASLEEVADYMPISLVNLVVFLNLKLLTNGLKKSRNVILIFFHLME